MVILTLYVYHECLVHCLPLAAPAVPDSALPIGMEQEDGSTQLVSVEPSEFVQYVASECKLILLQAVLLFMATLLHACTQCRNTVCRVGNAGTKGGDIRFGWHFGV